MPETINLDRQMEKQLLAELVKFMEEAGLVAASQGWRLYLVGGMVRDLLLKRNTFDLDLMVEGDAISLAQRLAETNRGKLTIHSRFGTAKLRWGRWSADLAMARAESYSRPGALPQVKPGFLADDLFRRDFTINAMAIELTPGRWGKLVDLYGGRSDLKRKLIRVLHEKSFIDDATRIWRAIRYEQRLDFNLEANTLRLLKRDISYLETISSDRIRHELELVLKEAQPEKALRRAGELSVLAKLHPALKADGWLAAKFEQARNLIAPETPPTALYLALLAYPLAAKETEELIAYLRPSRPLTNVLREINTLKAELKSLSQPRLRRSRVYSILNGYSPTALTAVSIAADSETVREHIQAFLTTLRSMKPALSGDDLKKMGITSGPQIKKILQKLLEARLDGKVKTKKGEVRLVTRLY